MNFQPVILVVSASKEEKSTKAVRLNASPGIKASIASSIFLYGDTHWHTSSSAY